MTIRMTLLAGIQLGSQRIGIRSERIQLDLMGWTATSANMACYNNTSVSTASDTYLQSASLSNGNYLIEFMPGS